MSKCCRQFVVFASQTSVGEVVDGADERNDENNENEDEKGRKDSKPFSKPRLHYKQKTTRFETHATYRRRPPRPRFVAIGPPTCGLSVSPRCGGPRAVQRSRASSSLALISLSEDEGNTLEQRARVWYCTCRSCVRPLLRARSRCRTFSSLRWKDFNAPLLFEASRKYCIQMPPLHDAS